MYDAEFHIMCSEKETLKKRINNFLEYGIYNYEKYKIKIVLLLEKNPSSSLEMDIKKYEKDNIHFEIARFELDEPSYKKCAYLTEIVPDRVHQARWFIGMDEDSITDIDSLIEHLDEDYDYQEKFYISTEPMKNTQPMEYELALLFGKGHWYCPLGGPYHEWEICCLSQKSMLSIIENDKSFKFLNIRKKTPKGWGDHCLGIASKFAKIYPIGSNLISGTNMITEHKILGGWLLHCHQIYKFAGIEKIFPLFKSRKNGKFENRKIFLSEIINGKIQDKGFYFLNKNGVLIGPQNHSPIGLWNSYEDNKLDLHFFEKENPIRFELNKSDLSLIEEKQNQYQIISE